MYGAGGRGREMGKAGIGTINSPQELGKLGHRQAAWGRKDKVVVMMSQHKVTQRQNTGRSLGTWGKGAVMHEPKEPPNGWVVGKNQKWVR